MNFSKLKNFWIFFSSILTTLTAFVIISTSLEVLMTKFSEQKVSKHLKETKDILTSFSIIKNTKSLFAENTRFAALDTLRLLLIINVHISHAYGFRIAAGSITLKKNFSEVFPKYFSDNIYFFIRSPLMLDSMFTLRFHF